jgi:hypothetical protein
MSFTGPSPTSSKLGKVQPLSVIPREYLTADQNQNARCFLAPPNASCRVYTRRKIKSRPRSDQPINTPSTTDVKSNTIEGVILLPAAR